MSLPLTFLVWIFPRIFYDENLGIIHFYVTLVLILLLSYAFLGLAGMPRRIPDYADSFYVYNAIASCFYGYLVGLFVFWQLFLKRTLRKLFWWTRTRMWFPFLYLEREVITREVGGIISFEINSIIKLFFWQSRSIKSATVYLSRNPIYSLMFWYLPLFPVLFFCLVVYHSCLHSFSFFIDYVGAIAILFLFVLS